MESLLRIRWRFNHWNVCFQNSVSLHCILKPFSFIPEPNKRETGHRKIYETSTKEFRKGRTAKYCSGGMLVCLLACRAPEQLCRRPSRGQDHQIPCLRICNTHGQTSVTNNNRLLLLRSEKASCALSVHPLFQNPIAFMSLLQRAIALGPRFRPSLTLSEKVGTEDRGGKKLWI